eukprot:3801630-Pyramimonas_sp.AAC.1
MVSAPLFRRCTAEVMYSELMRSIGSASNTCNAEAPNQLISCDDISADCKCWQDIAPSAGPAVLLGKATLHLNRA